VLWASFRFFPSAIEATQWRGPKIVKLPVAAVDRQEERATPRQLPPSSAFPWVFLGFSLAFPRLVTYSSNANPSWPNFALFFGFMCVVVAESHSRSLLKRIHVNDWPQTPDPDPTPNRTQTPYPGNSCPWVLFLCLFERRGHNGFALCLPRLEAILAGTCRVE